MNHHIGNLHAIIPTPNVVKYNRGEWLMRVFSGATLLLVMTSIALFCLYSWYFLQLAETLEPMTKDPALVEPAPQPQDTPPLAMSQLTLPEPPAMPVAAVAKPQAVAKLPVQPVMKAKPIVQVKIAQKIRPQTKLVTKPAKQPESQPLTPTIDVSQDSIEVTNAEPLLQQVEAGNGPVIEIAWPKGFAKRKRLYNMLVNCQGVQLGILADDTVHPITANKGLYSRLVRVVSGVMLPQEHREYQSSRFQGTPVRLFPRALDGRLMAGLRQLSTQLAMPFQTLSSVRGLYVMQGKRLYIQDLIMDGQMIPGQVLLADGCR
ncbi:MAG: hypothetical protein ACI8WB_002474 [Phenylobacterium sp.]|jgi:hypothetical protein